MFAPKYFGNRFFGRRYFGQTSAEIKLPRRDSGAQRSVPITSSSVVRVATAMPIRPNIAAQKRRNNAGPRRAAPTSPRRH